MAPKSIKFWSTIPLTNLGKVDKKEIKKLIASGE
jgi:non-ribosomal peptide synthetase component E (peptide arylation enzyme)